MPASGDNRGVGELPKGTITMLFSDIEGSTALLHRLGERYGEALSAQRALIRAAIAAWHGREMAPKATVSMSCSSPRPMQCAAAWRRSKPWPGMTGRTGRPCGGGWACLRGG